MALGIVSMLGAIFSAINTAKDECEEEIKAENKEHQSKLEKVVKKVKTYVVTIAFTVFAIFCFTFALHISAKQTAAAVTAAKFAQEALVRYKDAAKEVVGEKQERFIANKAAEKKTDEDKVDEKPVIETYQDHGEGTSLFYDPFSKTLFTYNRSSMDNVESELNVMLNDRGFICIQDLYDVARLDLYFDKALDLGVNEIDGPVRLGLEPIVLKKGSHAGEVAFVITMSVMPYYDYTE